MLLLAATLHAQEFSIGAGYEQTEVIDYACPSSLGGCNCGERGLNRGFGAHLSAAYPLSFLPFQLSMRLSGVMTQGKTEVEAFRGTVLLPDPAFPDDPGKARLVDQVVTQEQSFSVLEGRLDLAARYSFGFGLQARGGVSFGYRTFDSFTTVYHLAEPEDARFIPDPNVTLSEDGRTQLVYTSSGPEISPFNCAAIASLSYPIAITDHLAIVPEVGIRYEILTGTEGIDMPWPSANFNTGLSIRWSFPAEEPRTMLLLPQPSIDLYSIGADGGRMQQAIVTTYRVLHRRVTVPPHDGDSTIATEWIEEQIRSTPIEIEPDLADGAEIARWTIRLLRNGALITEQRSDAPEPQDFPIAMLTRDLKAGEIPSPLVAEFEVGDIEGRIVKARDELPFVAGKESREPDSTVTTYLLPMPEDIDPRTATEVFNEKQIRKIAAATDRMASITIAPLAPKSPTNNRLDTTAHHIATLLRTLLPHATVTLLPEYPGAPEDPHNGIAIVVMNQRKDWSE